jgi:ammonia channel protein AmtB
MSLLFKNNLPRARKFFIGSTVFFSGWTIMNVGSALELNPFWRYHGLATLAVFGKACGSGFSWWLVEKRFKKQAQA